MFLDEFKEDLRGRRQGEVMVVNARSGVGKSLITWSTIWNRFEVMLSMPHYEKVLDAFRANHPYCEFVEMYKFGVRTLTTFECVVVMGTLSGMSTDRSFPRKDLQYLLKSGVVKESSKDKDAPKHEDRIFVRAGRLANKCLRDWEAFSQL